MFLGLKNYSNGTPPLSFGHRDSFRESPDPVARQAPSWYYENAAGSVINQHHALCVATYSHPADSVFPTEEADEDDLGAHRRGSMSRV